LTPATTAPAPPGPATAIRVAIVDDDRRIRDGLEMLINGTPGYQCVGSVTRVEDAWPSRLRAQPDVVLLDIDLPGMSGCDGVEVLKTRFSQAQIVMLTVYADEDKVFTAICRGACGYLLKDTPPLKLLDAIAEAVAGGAPMSPDIARQVVGAFRKSAPRPAPPDERLTPQEVRLLQLLSDGYSYDGASAELNVSVNTIRNYIRSVYEKLHVHTKSEAVSKALRTRVIT
jgi:DNA-binding NarL/FixJ family response regulator